MDEMTHNHFTMQIYTIMSNVKKLGTMATKRSTYLFSNEKDFN